MGNMRKKRRGNEYSKLLRTEEENEKFWKIYIKKMGKRKQVKSNNDNDGVWDEELVNEGQKEERTNEVDGRKNY